MVSQDKLIKEGIRYSDNLFKIIEERVLKALEQSSSLEEFLERTKDFTLENPMVSTGYQDTMTNLITSITNNVRFERAAQRELVRTAISSRVGELIQNVGDDLKESIRETVKQGYDEGLHSRDIAKRMSHNIQSINSRRARTIARTEVARAYVISDYIVNKERGATGFTVVCRPDCCPICAEDYAGRKNHVPDVDGDGRLIGGNVGFLIDDVGMLPPRHPNCYDKETKVYTNNGWKYFKDLTDDDLVLSLNPQTNETEFIKPVQIIKHENTDDFLYHIHNKWFDVCVTSDHDCFIHQRRDGGNRGKYFEPQFRKPSELSSESRFLRCIDTDRENPNAININGLELEPSDFSFLMAWFISEGSVLHNRETAKSHSYPIKITQEIGSNREILEPRLKAICDKLGLRLAIGKSYFEFYSKPLYDYLVQLGYSHEKYIPDEVFSLNKECLNEFLDNYVLGDGHERKPNKYNSVERTLYTSSPRLRDDLSYLVLLCGFYPSISVHTKKGTVSKHKNGEYVQKNDVYQISINKSQYTTFSSCTVDKIPYTEMVYCVELPKWHTLWVMRNGKTSWNGNCRCSVNYFRGDGDEIRSQISRKKPTSTATTTTTSTGGTTQREPTKDELSKNLTPSERAKYSNYRRVIANHTKWLGDNPSAAADVIANHKAKLAKALAEFNALKAKALGGNVEDSPAPKPKPKKETKKETPKPKPKEESKEDTTPTKSEEEDTSTKRKIERNPHNKKFEDLVTPEDVAEYFGFEYSFGGFPQVDKENEIMVGKDGRRYRVGKNENKKGKYHKFYDVEHDCTIYFAQSITKPSKSKNAKGKIYIDMTSSGKGVKNLKDVIKMYDDAPKVLKDTNTSITFTNRRAKSLYAYNKMLDKKRVSNLNHNKGFEQITHGKKAAWIDMYVNCIEDDLSMGHSMQRTLYHEMAHGLDNELSEAWTNPLRFSDNRSPDGYGALNNQYPLFDEKGRKIGKTPEEIVDGISSNYGKRHWSKTFSFSEDFADAISMAAFKNISDKTGAVILPPGWTWTNDLKALTYEEWITEYNHKAEYLWELLEI